MGILAGALTWGVGEITYNHFRPSDKAQANRYEFAALNREEALASQKNAAVAYGTFGALLGLPDGCHRRSISPIRSSGRGRCPRRRCGW